VRKKKIVFVHVVPLKVKTCRTYSLFTKLVRPYKY